MFRHIVDTEFPNQPWVWQIIGNELLESYFPYHLYVQRGEHNYSAEDCIPILLPVFRSNYRFWLYCYPIAKLPKRLAYPYSLAVRALLKAKRSIRSVWWSVRYAPRRISKVNLPRND